MLSADTTKLLTRVMSQWVHRQTSHSSCAGESLPCFITLCPPADVLLTHGKSVLNRDRFIMVSVVLLHLWCYKNM